MCLRSPLYCIWAFIWLNPAGRRAWSGRTGALFLFGPCVSITRCWWRRLRRRAPQPLLIEPRQRTTTHSAEQGALSERLNAFFLTGDNPAGRRGEFSSALVEIIFGKNDPLRHTCGSHEAIVFTFFKGN